MCSLWISRYYSVPIDAGDFIMSVEPHQNMVNALEIVCSRIHGSHGRAYGKLMTTTKLFVRSTIRSALLSQLGWYGRHHNIFFIDCEIKQPLLFCIIVFVNLHLIFPSHKYRSLCWSPICRLNPNSMKVHNSSINKMRQKRIGHWQTFGSKSAYTNTPTRNATTPETG